MIEDLVRRDDAELAALAPDEGAAAALWLLRDARTATRLFASATHWAPRLRALVRKEQASVAAEQLLSYLLEVLDPDDADRLGEVLAELDPTVEEIDMNERETFYEACYRKPPVSGKLSLPRTRQLRGQTAATTCSQSSTQMGSNDG